MRQQKVKGEKDASEKNQKFELNHTHNTVFLLMLTC